jgi:polyisoprenoid-binding protein YceI
MKKLFTVAAVPLILLAQQACSTPLDVAHSQIGFTLTQMNSPMDGQFKRFSGDAVLDAKNPGAGHADITISTASISLPTPAAKAQAENSDWFNVARYPTARFVTSSIKPLGANRYQVSGTLSLKGQNHGVSAPFTISRKGALTLVEGVMPISRLAFKIGEGEWTDTDTVADTVQIKFSIAIPNSSK